MKVGEGNKTFNDLQWLAAPASDVYAWAKNKKLAYADMPDEVKNISDNASAAIKAAIEALDVPASNDNDDTNGGVVISVISETDGKISVTRRALTADDIPTLAIAKVNGLQTALDDKGTKTAVETNAQNIADEIAHRTAADTAIEGKITELTNKIGNLTNIMNFRGAVESKAAITDPVEGDVIAVTAGDDAGKEFIYSNGDWIEFGYVDGNTTAIGNLQKKVEGIDSRLASAEGDLTTIKGSGDGSIAKALSDAKDYADTKKSEVIGTDEDASTATTIAGAKKYADEKVKALADNAVATNTSDISGLKEKVQNGTFISTTNQFVAYNGDEIILDCGGAE